VKQLNEEERYGFVLRAVSKKLNKQKLYFAILGFELSLLARQMLYHLSHAPNPFCFFFFLVIFLIGSQVYSRLA
jgi:hypothetical protein